MDAAFALGLAAFFGEAISPHADTGGFELDSAYQGREGLEMVEAAIARAKLAARWQTSVVLPSLGTALVTMMTR